MGRSLHHSIDSNTYLTQFAAAATAATSAVFDRQGFGAVTYVMTKAACTATTGTFAISLQSGTATSGHALATTTEMIGTQTQTMTATTVDTVKMSYIGSDRYVSVRVTPGAATGAFSTLAIGLRPIKQPTS
jgi:hypothetical protein